MKKIGNKRKNKEKKKRKIKKENIIKTLILIILFFMIGITSFKTGCKYYLLKNMYLNDISPASVESGVARWYFNAKIIHK